MINIMDVIFKFLRVSLQYDINIQGGAIRLINAKLMQC